jgi:type II secretory pathway pseudopilin PulG
MRFETRPISRGANGGFTLAEVLAALLFMAIVIPVSVQALRIASQAGEVGNRKTQAMRIAERLLNESISTTNLTQSGVNGTVIEGTREYTWHMRTEPWSQAGTNQLQTAVSRGGLLGGEQPPVNQFTANQVVMNLVTVEVLYPVQGQEYSVRLSTLVSSQP